MELQLNNVTSSVIEQLRRESKPRSSPSPRKYGLETTFSAITLGPPLADQEIVEALHCEDASDGLIIAVIRFRESSITRRE
jgi:hypothetical protein